MALGALIISPYALWVPADADLWWHILAGRLIIAERTIPPADPWSYTYAGAPWINHEWLADLILALAWDSGGAGALLLWRASLLLVWSVALVDVLWRRWPNPLGVVLLVGLAAPGCAAMMNLRPYAMTIAFVPLLVALVDRVPTRPKASVFALLVLAVVWVNSHAGYLLGCVMAFTGLFWARAGASTDLAGKRTRAWCVAGAGIVVLALFINPYGLDLLSYVSLELRAEHPSLIEWNPPRGGLMVGLVLSVALPLAAAAITRPPLQPVEWLMLAMVAVGALRNAKFTVLALMLGAVCLASVMGASRLGRPRSALLQPGTFRGRLLVAAAGLAIAFGGVDPSRPLGRVTVEPALYPVGALAFLRASDGTGRLWSPLGWGGYVLYHLHDRFRVALDGRNTTVYPVAYVIAQTDALVSGNVNVVRTTYPDVLLVYSSGPLFEALEADAAFDRVFIDGTAAVFVRRGVPFTPAVRPALPTTDFPG